jgi:hypothetical protein
LKREPRLSERSGPWGGRAMEALIDALALCRASHLETIGTADAGSMSTCKEARLVTAVVAPANVGWETGNQTRLAQRPPFGAPMVPPLGYVSELIAMASWANSLQETLRAKQGRRCCSTHVVACDQHVCCQQLPPSDSVCHPVMARMWHETSA